MKKLSFFLFTILFMPFSAFAAPLDYGNKTLNPYVNDTQTIKEYIEGIGNFLLGVVGALAVMFIIIGGLQLMSSAGNSQKIETAKKTLTYAITGLILVIFSKVILNLITGSIAGMAF